MIDRLGKNISRKTSINKIVDNSKMNSKQKENTKINYFKKHSITEENIKIITNNNNNDSNKISNIKFPQNNNKFNKPEKNIDTPKNFNKIDYRKFQTLTSKNINSSAKSKAFNSIIKTRSPIRKNESFIYNNISREKNIRNNDRGFSNHKFKNKDHLINNTMINHIEKSSLIDLEKESSSKLQKGRSEQKIAEINTNIEKINKVTSTNETLDKNNETIRFNQNEIKSNFKINQSIYEF